MNIFESKFGGSDVILLGMSRPNISEHRPYVDLDDLKRYGTFVNQALDIKSIDYMNYEGASEVTVYIDKTGHKYHDSFETDFTYALFKTLDGEDGCVMLTKDLFIKLYTLKQKGVFNMNDNELLKEMVKNNPEVLMDVLRDLVHSKEREDEEEENEYIWYKGIKMSYIAYNKFQELESTIDKLKENKGVEYLENKIEDLEKKLEKKTNAFNLLKQKQKEILKDLD